MRFHKYFQSRLTYPPTSTLLFLLTFSFESTNRDTWRHNWPIKCPSYTKMWGKLKILDKKIFNFSSTVSVKGLCYVYFDLYLFSPRGSLGRWTSKFLFRFITLNLLLSFDLIVDKSLLVVISVTYFFGCPMVGSVHMNLLLLIGIYVSNHFSFLIFLFSS